MIMKQKDIMASLAQLDPSKFEILPSLPPKGDDQVAIAIGAIEIYLPLDGSLGTILYTAKGSKSFSRERFEVFGSELEFARCNEFGH